VTRLAQNRARAILLAAIVAVSVGLAAGAFAYWMGSGSGAATTMLASPAQLTLGPGTAQAQLSPGHDASVAVLATNSNPYFVAIGTLTLDTAAGVGGFDVDAGHSGCDLSVLHFAPQSNGGAGWSIPPKVASTDGTQAIDVGDALSMEANAADACQGASFTVHLIAGG
jgi:hypothetical protein